MKDNPVALMCRILQCTSLLLVLQFYVNKNDCKSENRKERRFDCC